MDKKRVPIKIKLRRPLGPGPHSDQASLAFTLQLSGGNALPSQPSFSRPSRVRRQPLLPFPSPRNQESEARIATVSPARTTSQTKKLRLRRCWTYPCSSNRQSSLIGLRSGVTLDPHPLSRSRSLVPLSVTFTPGLQ